MDDAATYQRVDSCRVCHEDALSPFLDLGAMPPANAFLDAPDDQETAIPLEVVVCENCSHVQLQHTVDPEVLFSDYHYFSSASTPLLDHYGDYAETVTDRYLDPEDLVVEIGSNDGVLLRQFGPEIETLGVDPAENVAEVAREHGVETITSLFDPSVARQIREERGAAQAICANNVVGHVHDLHGLMTGVDALLADDGVFVVEVPYLVDLLSNHQFDTIYHEHISYFSVRSFRRLVERFDMQVLDVDRVAVQGGTIRLHVGRTSAGGSPTRMATDLGRLELAMGLDGMAPYEEFAARTESIRDHLTTLLGTLGEDGSRIVGYGAPAKGNVLLNYCDVGTETLEYLTDTTPTKQGTYSPGMHLPVRSPEAFREDPPEYALMLPWNFQEAILERETAFREDGGEFVVPIPYVNVV